MEMWRGEREMVKGGEVWRGEGEMGEGGEVWRGEGEMVTVVGLTLETGSGLIRQGFCDLGWLATSWGQKVGAVEGVRDLLLARWHLQPDNVSCL